MDWTATIDGVRVAGELRPHPITVGNATDALLIAWLEQHFAPEDRGRLQLFQFLRCATRGIFLRCREYTNDDKRVDYCVQLRPRPDVVLDAPVAPLVEPATWYGNVNVFFCARLPPLMGRNAAVEHELLAVVQPFAEVPHFFADMDMPFLTAEEAPAWEKLRQWMHNGELLPHMVSVSRAQSLLLAKRVVRVADIAAKRCLCEISDRDTMFIVNLQNFVEEL